MRALALVATVFAFVSAPATAQGVGADSSCTVESCGIEMKRSLLIGFRLEQGGEPLPRYGPLGLGTPQIANAVRDSPVALAYAHDYERHVRQSSRLQLGAYALLLIGSFDPFDVFGDEVRIGFVVGAAGLSAASLSSALHARRSIESAVDTYNESLPR